MQNITKISLYKNYNYKFLKLSLKLNGYHYIIIYIYLHIQITLPGKINFQYYTFVTPDKFYIKIQVIIF